MATVYRAVDTRLARPAALKFLAPQLANDGRARARFLREARAASALDHPNIGTIYQVDEHAGQPFLAMALYEGQTLRARLAAGPMELAEVEAILAQLAAALAAAHAAGVVHRDVKPANVMLTNGKVKLLDFGLAKRMVEGADADDITRTGEIVGTVHYMSPEQLRGESVDARGDLWSLGAIGYEMLAGRPPFIGASAAAVMSRALTEMPPPLRALRPDVPEYLERLLEQLLAKDASDRPVEAFEVARVVAEKRVPNDRRAAPAPAPRRAIAILGFRNLAGHSDAAWLATALIEMLSTELSATRTLRIVPGGDVARMRLELGVTNLDSLSRDRLARIHRRLDADLLISGSYVVLGGKLRLDVRLQDAAQGDTIEAIAEAGTEDELFDLVGRAGARLADRLGAAPASTETGRARSALPARRDAARRYAEGLARLRQLDAPEARRLLEDAVALEPEFPLAHAALAEALSALGHDTLAGEAAQRAFGLSGSLRREDRLLVEGRFRESIGDWARATDIYRTLHEFFPDNLDYGLRLAAAQSLHLSGHAALETVAALRALPRAEGDPRLDLAEAEAYDALGDYRATLASAQRAVRGGNARGARLLVARALRRASWAQANLGEIDRAFELAEEARAIHQALGDRVGVAWALHNLALIEATRGRLARAGEHAAAGAALAGELGCRQAERWHRIGLAHVHFRRGDLAESRRHVAAAPAGGDAEALGEMAILDGMIATAAGALEDAARALARGVAVYQELGEARAIAWGRWAQGELARARGDLVAARREHEAALAARVGLGLAAFAAESRIALARIALDERRTPDAVELLEAAVAPFVAGGCVDMIAVARALLALARLGTGERELAAREIAVAERLAATSEALEARLEVTIAAARVHATLADSESDAASERLAVTAKDAATAGLAWLAFEARATSAALAPPLARQALLGAVARDALAAGFLGVHRKATE